MSRLEDAIERGFDEAEERRDRVRRRNKWRTELDPRDPDFLDDSEEENDDEH